MLLEITTEGESIPVIDDFNIEKTSTGQCVTFKSFLTVYCCHVLLCYDLSEIDCWVNVNESMKDSQYLDEVSPHPSLSRENISKCSKRSSQDEEKEKKDEGVR